MLCHYFNNLGELPLLNIISKWFNLHSYLENVYTIVYHDNYREAFMSEVTTTRNFRQNLKQFFDLAKSEPIAINRGTDRFVLLHENEFNKLKDQVMYLQKSLIAVMEDMDAGGPQEMGDIDKFHEDLLAEIEDEDQRILKQEKKKAVG